MSRIPGASPITDDIEDIRHSGEDEDRSLVGGDVDAIPEPAPGEEPEPSDEAQPSGRG